MSSNTVPGLAAAKPARRVATPRKSCERFLFVQNGAVSQAPDFAALVRDERVRTYLGALAPML